MNRLVMETLEPLPQDRKCFRLINGVLVERTVKDVLPALKTNLDGLKQVLEELLKQYKGKQDEMDKWKASPVPVSTQSDNADIQVAEKEQHPSSAESVIDSFPCTARRGWTGVGYKDQVRIRA